MFATDKAVIMKAVLADGMIVGGIDKTLSEWEKELEDVFFYSGVVNYVDQLQIRRKPLKEVRSD